jgi:hypothetical protein
MNASRSAIGVQLPMQINVRLLSFSLHRALEEVLYSGNSGERKSAESPFQFQEATIVHP